MEPFPHQLTQYRPRPGRRYWVSWCRGGSVVPSVGPCGGGPIGHGPPAASGCVVLYAILSDLQAGGLCEIGGGRAAICLREGPWPAGAGGSTV